MNKVLRKNIALNGKWMPSDDSLTIGTNFKTQTNMRPDKTHPKAVKGMTKINTSVINATYLKVRSAYQFHKEYPNAENHVLAQAFNAGETASKLYENITAVPAQGNFEATEIWSDGSGAGKGRFSNAPNGQMAYANGVEAVIWSGDEQEIASFVNFDPDGTFRYDFTREVNNDLTTTNNIATLKRVTASTAKLLLHCDGADTSTTFTDSGGTVHTATAVGDAQLDTAQKKFGTASGLFDGTGDYLTIPDHADFDFSGGTFTIDLWVASGPLGVIFPTGTYYSQGTDANNYIRLYSDGTNIKFDIYAAGAPVVQLTAVMDSNPSPPVVFWHHLAIVENASEWYLFIDGVRWHNVTDASRAANYTGLVTIGAFNDNATISDYINTRVDEFRALDTAEWTSNFTPKSSAYAAEKTNLYIGLSRPINYSSAVGGFKFYLGTVNTTAASVSIYEYTATGWNNMTIGTDGTETGGDTTMGQDGTITVTSTGTPIQKVIDQSLLYWYWIVLDGVDDSITVEQVTAQISIQPVSDIWDGLPRQIVSALQYDSTTETYTDFSTTVFAEEFDSQNSATFLSLNAMATTKSLLFGFTEQMMAVSVNISKKVNETANTILTVERSLDGVNWTSVVGLDDGTSVDGKSFAKSGIVSWNPIGESSEHRMSLTAQKTAKIEQKQFDPVAGTYKWIKAAGYETKISEPIPLYFYKFSFSQQLSSDDIYLYFVTAMSAPKEIPTNVTFPFYADNCLWLCRDNKALRSAPNQPDVWNGIESAELRFGNGTPLTAASSMQMRTGAGLHNMKLFFTQSEIYSLTGSSLENYQPFPIEMENGFSVGCGAPDTLKRIMLTTEEGTQNAFIWMTYTGVYLFNGISPVRIWDDIRHFFEPDETGARRIKLSELPNAYAFIDYNYMNYHLIFMDDSGAMQELVYNFRYNKGFSIDRTTNKKLRCGLDVVDTDGNHYPYGFIDTGYMERLENGADFDGTDITCTLQFGDFPLDPDGELLRPAHISAHRLDVIGEIGGTTIAATHYGDTNTTGTSLTAISPVPATNHRVRQAYEQINLGNEAVENDALFHSLKYVKVAPFEPIYIGLEYEIQETEVKER